MTATAREVRIAHLEIHGWVPMVNKGSGRRGIYNEQVGVGFSTSGSNEPFAVKRWDRAHMRDSYESCSWDDVTDDHLNAIEARLTAV